jgi:hypothetical protein
MARINWP